jgi:hypothetical protein
MISTFSKDSSSIIDNAEGLRFSRVLVGPLVSLWVGRPGLDPGTLGLKEEADSRSGPVGSE